MTDPDTTPRERPLLFSGPMIRELLAGRKTRTRRLITARNSLLNGGPCYRTLWSLLDFESPQVFVDGGPSPAGNPGPYLHVPLHEERARDAEFDPSCIERVYPAVQPGDKLWCKETFSLVWPKDCDDGVVYDDEHPDGRPVKDRECSVAYAASGDTPAWHEEKDKPMWQPSIFMPRWASRLTLEVTEVRAERLQAITEAEAVAEGVEPDFHAAVDGESVAHTIAFAVLWDTINGSRAPWVTNPWVWVLAFRRVEAT